MGICAVFKNDNAKYCAAAKRQEIFLGYRWQGMTIIAFRVAHFIRTASVSKAAPSELVAYAVAETVGVLFGAEPTVTASGTTSPMAVG